MTVERLVALVPLVGPIALVGVALLSRLQPGRRPDLVRRALSAASVAGVAAALGSVVLLVLAGPFPGVLANPETSTATIRVDALGVAMLTMVSLLVLVIGRFSATYLDGDGRHGIFLGRLAATAAAVEVLVLADSLLLFWVAWVATSVCLHRLLVFYPDRHRAIVSARKKFLVARLGDVLLGGAFLVLFRVYGTESIGQLIAGAAEGPGNGWLTVAAVLLALSALLKSAQFPTHGWLVEVMETPTPVSALLHAGILNAGPFLILRFSPVLPQAPAASWLLLIVGGFTAAFASVVLRTQPSVKVALGYSSTAHMGFTLFLCGLGVYPAAALHLIAHSFYKAHAFLSAGSVVDLAQSRRIAVPARRWDPAGAMLGALLAGATFVGVAWALGFLRGDNLALLVLGGVVIVGLAQLVGAAVDRRARPTVVVQVTAMAGLVAATFFALEESARRTLLGSLPTGHDPDTALLVLAAAIVAAWTAIVTLQITGLGRGSRFANRLRVHLRHGLYANALFDRLVASRNHS